MNSKNAEYAPLWERLGEPHPRREVLNPQALVDHRLQGWKIALNTSDDKALAIRCEVAGYSFSAALEELGLRGGDSTESVPRSLSLRRCHRLQPSKSVDTISFGDILLPIAERAVRDLHRSLSSESQALFSVVAFECLKINLLENLSFISHHALLNEFTLMRTLRKSSDQENLSTSQATSRTIYGIFCSSLSVDEGARFYHNYPVVRRLFTLKIRQWKRCCRSLIRHFSEDRECIQRELGLTRFDSVDHLTLGLSDPHRGGYSVAILRAPSGDRVVYKPRRLSLEIGFSRVITHVNQYLQGDGLRGFGMMSRGDHGWCEYVENSQLTDNDQIAAFFYRAGILLAILHSLRATDCHFENIACWNGFPVLIDLETLCHQDNNLLFNSSDIKGIGAPFFHSVTRVGLLPAVRNDPDAMELSPLAPEAIQPQHLSRMYEHSGTDRMALREVSEARAIPTLVGEQHSVPRHAMVSELKRGFTAGYTAVLQGKAELLGSEGLLSSLRSEECRFVARNTQLYGWLSQRCLESHLLRSGIDRSIELERLFRGALQGPKQKAWFKVAEAERKALECLDIPHFTTRLSDRHLRSNGRIVASNLFERTPLELVSERIERMGSDDLNSQLAIVEMLFAQKNLGPTTPRPVRPVALPSVESSLRDSSSDVGDRIWRHRVLQLDGSPSWLTLHPLLKGGLYKVMPGGPGLYHGSAGIGLFYAAHFAVTQDERSRERSRAAFANALDAHTLSALLAGGHIDMGEGISGIAYALCRGADLLGDPKLGRRAVELLLQIPESTIARETQAVCVVSGLAGLLLTLDVVLQRVSNHKLRAVMSLVAECIIGRATEVVPNVSVWRGPEGEILAGFAHGSVGVAYALARAARHCGDTGLRTAARKGFQHAIDAYDLTLGNWVEGRTELNGQPTACSWCHGAIGVGLGIACEGDESLQGVALAQARALDILKNDLEKGPPTQSLCCGSAGALDFLLNVPETKLSVSLSNGIVDSLLDTDSHLCIAGNSAKVLMPGLFNGSGGVAYQLLRFIEPERIPSVLLLN